MRKKQLFFLSIIILTKTASMHFSKISLQNKLLIVEAEELWEWQLKLTPFSSIGVVYQVGRIGGLPNGNTNRGKCRPSPLKKVNPPQIKNNILISWYYQESMLCPFDCCFNRVSKKKVVTGFWEWFWVTTVFGHFVTVQHFWYTLSKQNLYQVPFPSDIWQHRPETSCQYALPSATTFLPPALVNMCKCKWYLSYILWKIINFSHWINNFPHSMRSSASFNILAIIT